MNPHEARTSGPQVIFALYRPHPGKDQELQRLIAQHMPILRRLELVTDRPNVLVRSANGTYVEILEWRSPECASQAEQHPEVAGVWEAMAQIADLPALESLPEIKRPFSSFEPVNLNS